MAQLERVVARLRRERERPILVYNMSFVVPAERIHWHAGTTDSLSTRIRRFNLALIEIARRVPISIIDVDDIVARMGAARVKLDTVHCNAAGHRAVAESVARVLAEHGLLRQAS
jgi:lysophospholipase L1-like esterase